MADRIEDSTIGDSEQWHIRENIDTLSTMSDEISEIECELYELLADNGYEPNIKD